MRKDLIKGISPELEAQCVTYKQPKKGQKSVIINKKVLSTCFNKAAKVGKTAKLIIVIQGENGEAYTFGGLVTKSKSQ